MPRLPRGIRALAQGRQNAQARAADALARRVDGLVRREFNAAFRRGIDRERLRAITAKVERLLDVELRRTARTAFRGWRRATVSSTGQPSRKLEPDDEALDRERDKPLKGKTWQARLKGHGPKRVGQRVRGKKRREAAEALAPEINRLRARAATLARTEAARLNNAMRDKAMKEVAGERLVAWRYTTMQDDRVRPTHAALDGKEFKVGKKRIPLPNGPGCRCYYLPVMGPKT